MRTQFLRNACFATVLTLCFSCGNLWAQSFNYYTNPPNRFAFAKSAKPAAFPTPSQCVAAFGLACYTPALMKTAYNVPDGLDGAGQTIVIVDAYGSPTVRTDLQVFDATFGLPDPTLNIIYPGGKPVYNPRQNHNETSWAEETSLDVQWAHAIAPAATIDLVIAANNGGNVLNNAVRYAVVHHLGNVISMSWGAPEAAIRGRGNNTQVMQAHANFEMAKNAGITAFASSGDWGAGNLYASANALYPASDPLVTAVGGTNLFMADDGTYTSETVWNDADPSLCPFGCTAGVFGATGGSPSLIFPDRSTSDVSYNASVYTGVLVYLGFLGPDNSGFYFFGGTSEGAPQWAAITALADQKAGHALGYLNPTFHTISEGGAYASDFHDVTVGQNAFFIGSSSNIGAGFSAGTGYDYPTGIGSPNVGNLIGTLAP